MIGRRLSHYEILAPIGEGGMGVVYKARDTHLDRFVAIKVLDADATADPERKRRFVQEAKAASALNHPGIITIYDISSDDGTDFIAMEYVQGRTLEQLIRGRGLARRDLELRDSGRRQRWPRPTPPASCTATSSRPTSWSPTTAS